MRELHGDLDIDFMFGGKPIREFVAGSELSLARMKIGALLYARVPVFGG